VPQCAIAGDANAQKGWNESGVQKTSNIFEMVQDKTKVTIEVLF